MCFCNMLLIAKTKDKIWNWFFLLACRRNTVSPLVLGTSLCLFYSFIIQWLSGLTNKNTFLWKWLGTRAGLKMNEKAASMSTKTNKLCKKISTKGLATQQQQCNMELEFVYTHTHIQQRLWAGSPKCSPLRGPPYPKMLCILVKKSFEQKWRTVEVKWSRNKLVTHKICTSAQPYLFYLVCMRLFFLFFILSLFYYRYVFYSIV